VDSGEAGGRAHLQRERCPLAVVRHGLPAEAAVERLGAGARAQHGHQLGGGGQPRLRVHLAEARQRQRARPARVRAVLLAPRRAERLCRDQPHPNVSLPLWRPKLEPKVVMSRSNIIHHHQKPICPHCWGTDHPYGLHITRHASPVPVGGR
jgi:hypothetical protein